MANEITIAIDGKEITTQPGKMVLEAAIEAGIYVPYLCYHPGMKPFAACRVCVISLEGGKGFPTSCTLPVADGMKIQSDSPAVNELRRSVMEMLIAEHPDGCLTCHRVDICGPNDVCLRHVSVNDRCVTCPKNERCEFKDTVRYLGMELESPLGYEYRDIPLELGDPFYDRDYNLCILCARCVRACEEIRGDDAICIIDRSGKALVGTSFGSSLLESGCEFCGACIDVCPVGALVETENKWEKAKRVQRTICPHCSVGCQLNLEVNEQGRIIRAIPELNSPSNRGQACYKGKFGMEFVSRNTRLRKPQVRRNGVLEKVSWDEALDYIAIRLKEYRGDSFAILTSSTSTNEEHYLAQKFARAAMHTNNVDQCSNTRPELVLALEQSLGYAAATNQIWELEQAGCILVVNANLTEEHNVVGVPIKRASRNGTKLLVIDPREVELTRYADYWLRPLPGTEHLLLAGILKSIIDQRLERTEWLDTHSEDTETLRFALRSLDIDRIAELTQVSVEGITGAARLFGQAENAAIVYALDNIPGDLHRDCVQTLVDLSLVTGNLGRPGCGIYPMRQGTNEQGAWDVGCLPDRLPGYQLVENQDARRNLEEVWGCSLPASKGLGVAEALTAVRNAQIKAMILIGYTANVTDDKIEDSLKAFENLEFLVIHDTFPNELVQIADVVLPRSTFAEKDGTYTNLERRIQRVRPTVEIKNNQSQPESWVISQIAIKMGIGGFDFPSANEIMEEIARVTSIYAGVSYRRLEEEASLVLRTQLEAPKPTQMLYASKEYRGILWPCSVNNGPDTPILYADGFPSGRANPITPRFREPDDEHGSEYPIWFVPGRVLLQSEREMRVEKGKVNRIVREELVQINPSDASQWAIREGDLVEVWSTTRLVVGLTTLDDSMPPGMIASTSLFGQLMVDLESSEEMDPMANVPGLNITRARISVIPRNGVKSLGFDSR
jgi:formate dehydrogenase alpha subunit